MKPREQALLMGRVAFLLCCLCPRAVSPQIILTEIMFDPLGPENADEFVEMVNISSGPVDLAGWSLGDGTGEDALMDAGGGLTLGPGRTAVVFDADYGTQSRSYDGVLDAAALILTVDGSTLGSAGLSNATAETVTLKDPSGRTVDAVLYTIGNAAGHSDERVDVPPAGSGAWEDSKSLLGTPGGRNSVARLEHNLSLCGLRAGMDGGARGLWVNVKNTGSRPVEPFSVEFFRDADRDSAFSENECLGIAARGSGLASGDSAAVFQAWSSGPGPAYVRAVLAHGDDHSGDDTLCVRLFMPYPDHALSINEILFSPLPGESEWVEIFNPGPESAELSGWRLSDRDSARKSQPVSAPFLLRPGAYAILSPDSTVLIRFPESGFCLSAVRPFPSLNNDSDEVALFDESGKMIDKAAYSCPAGFPRGVSLERMDSRNQSDNPLNWQECLDARGGTPGRINSAGVSEGGGGEYFSAKPDPFAPGTDGLATLRYNLPVPSAYLKICVYDSRGRKARYLERGRLCPGQGVVFWDGRDDFGNTCPIGQYILFLEAAEKAGGRVFRLKKVMVLAGKM